MEKLPLSALNHFLYCRRRVALIHLEQVFLENAHTVEGNITHERVDTPGYHVLRGVKVLRAIPVWSDRLGLSGRCDVVEKHRDGTLVPVEFKKSRRKSFINDDVQVCAQAICLEEALGVEVKRGAIFFAASKHRRDIDFTKDLRRQVEEAALALHKLIRRGITPPAMKKKACQQCSLIEVCLPDAFERKRGVDSWFRQQIEAALE